MNVYLGSPLIISGSITWFS